MKPFFTYYGGKYRISPKYPPPMHGTIVEPFAGSAGYSVRYPHHKVILADINPKVIGLWKYLIRVKKSEILRLPLEIATNVNDLNIPEEAKWLIGFWCNKGAATPHLSPSRWMRDGIRPNSFWGAAIRDRIAYQVDEIRHWKALYLSWDQLKNRDATWFIDPPYHQSGKRYFGFDALDFSALGEWCRGRKGQVIVCEQQGAEWLPFVPFMDAKGLEGARGKKKSKEVIWGNACREKCKNVCRSECLYGW